MGALEGVGQDRAGGKIGFYELPYDKAIVEKVATTADWVKAEFEALVVLGIGESALGTTALISALAHPMYNEVPRDERGGTPKVYVADNIDPDSFSALLDSLDLEKTLFNVISKSGSTAETMSRLCSIGSMTSTSSPTAMAMRSRKASRLEASRTADVATAQIRSAW